MTDQAPEHHPHPEQIGVHDPWRKRCAEKGVQACGGAFDRFDLRPQGRGQLVGQLVVGLGDQCIDAAEMMIEQAHGNPGLRRDTPHRNPGMAVAGEAGEGGGNQQIAAFIGVGTAQFGRDDGHGKAFDQTPECQG